jgi:hypothetical protein
VNNTQFVHNLRGNTQIMRNVRQVTKSVNPKELATWSLAELHARLCEYLYDVYEAAEHPALGQSPRAAFLARLAETGERQHRTIPYDEEFLIYTLPTTTRGTAKVVAGKGVKIRHVYYWCEAFRDPGVRGRQIAIRFDPFDAGVPEPVNSVVVGDPELFQVEHSDKEPRLVFIKAVTTKQAETNLLISTTSGHEASLLVISRGESQTRPDIDFLLRYETREGFLIEPSGYPSALIGETLAAGQPGPVSLPDSPAAQPSSMVTHASLSLADPVKGAPEGAGKAPSLILSTSRLRVSIACW